MRAVGRGQKVAAAPPVQGTVARVPGEGTGAGGEDAERAAGAAAATEGVVALVDGAGAAALAPFGEALVAIVCMDEDPDGAFADASRALDVPCVVGVSFDGDPPVDGSLVLVDCSRSEEGLVLVVDGGTGEPQAGEPV
jgi:phosphohistidine swiveling domain-containing protein